MSATKPVFDVLEYCAVHAAKCDDEGLHTRAIVLREAAAEIERLRAALAAIATRQPTTEETTVTAADKTALHRFVLPRCFWVDHFERCADHPGRRIVVKQTARRVTVDLDDVALEDFRSDAEHYANDGTDALRCFVRSARAALAAIATRQPTTEETTVTAANAKYTKGPWRQFVAADGLYAISADEKPESRIVVAREIDNEDDAHLIAAAPDLVEALKAIHLKLSNGDATFEELMRAAMRADDIARAALSKAGV